MGKIQRSAVKEGGEGARLRASLRAELFGKMKNWDACALPTNESLFSNPLDPSPEFLLNPFSPWHT